jgi:hypothetical protein
MAHLVLGIKSLLSLSSAIVSLLLARFIQSQLYYPGAFKKEMQGFRCGKLALALLVTLSAAAYSGVLLAIDILPFMFFYFLLSGLLLCMDLLSIKKNVSVIAFVIIALLVSLKQICFVGIFFGILDSLFNIRMYFSRKLEKSI